MSAPASARATACTLREGRTGVHLDLNPCESTRGLYEEKATQAVRTSPAQGPVLLQRLERLRRRESRSRHRGHKRRLSSRITQNSTGPGPGWLRKHAAGSQECAKAKGAALRCQSVRSDSPHRKLPICGGVSQRPWRDRLPQARCGFKIHAVHFLARRQRACARRAGVTD